MPVAHDVAESTAVPNGPRALPRRRRLAHLSLGHIVMIVAGLLAVLTNLALLRSADDRVLVAVAGRDLPVGSSVTQADLRLAPVAADAGVLDQLIPEERLATIAGIVSRELRSGDLVLTTDVVPAAGPDRLRAMSIPIDTVHAVGGAIRVGDRVDVVATEDGTATYVLTGAEVLAVAPPTGGPLGTARGFFVTVALDQDEVLRLAQALDASSVEVIRSTGAEPVDVEPEADD